MTAPRGLFVVYTGHGKGKTTAALGLVFRALGVAELDADDLRAGLFQ
jgi:ATP:corrinoid adenosyltransferase